MRQPLSLLGRSLVYSQQRSYRMVRIAAVAVVLLGAVVLLVSAPARCQDQGERERLVADYQRAEKLRAKGQYSQAAKLYESITTAAEGLFGAEHPDTLDLLNNRAQVLAVLGRFEVAKEIYSRCIRVAEAKYPDGPALPRYQNGLGNLYRLLGQLEKAEKLIRESLRLREKLGPGHELDVAESLHMLAVLLQERGELTEAEPHYERCLKLRKEKLGEDDPTVADTLNLMGQLYALLVQDEKALKCYRQGLSIRQGRFGSQHLATAASCNDLATFYMERNQFPRAEPLFRRALDIFEQQLGRDHPDTAKVYHNLSWTYLNLKNIEKAEPLQAKAIQIWSKKLSADHPTLALGLYNQAILYFVAGRDEKAESIQRRALRMRERSLGASHLTASESLLQLARADACAGRWDRAAESFDQASRRMRRFTARVLPALLEPQQLDFLQHQYAPEFHAALSLAWQQRHDPKLAEMSAAWILNGKAISQEVLAAQILLARNSSDKDAVQLLKQLRSIRGQIASLTALPADDALREQRQRLTDRETELVKRLGRATGRPLDADPWVELDQIRKTLPANTVLIEIARFPVCDFQARSPSWSWKEDRYAAWIIPASGSGGVRLVDLGPAREVESAVKQVRKVLEASYQQIREKGAEEAEKELLLELDKLSRLVLRPLEKYAGGAENWILSADAALWLAPWSALTMADGRYVVEKYPLRYVTTGRDLAGRSPATGKARPPVMVAGPDFDFRSAEARRARRNSERDEERRAVPASLLPTSLEEIGRVRALPGARAEAEKIKPYLERYTGQNPLVYTDEKAQESVVKALHGPSVLMLSTHGFFLEDPSAHESSGDRLPSRPRVNPLLRCGLLLAGCNRRGDKEAGTAEDDGILTGLEIVGCDLRGTGLVVLSACETGLGEVRNGEGVAGLRQAFQLAGGESVLATLWSVEDRETARLMGSFFSHLAQGQSRAEALQQAQRDRIKALRQRYGAAHPFLWAAFTLTGQ